LVEAAGIEPASVSPST